jgi:hypothetical protein
MTPAASTVTEVLERLEAIDSVLPPSDGVKWFNKLYLEVTQQVATSVPGGHQAAPGFLEALDVAFGNLYFEALEAAGSDAALPSTYPFHAWKPQSRPGNRHLRHLRRAWDRAERRQPGARGLRVGERPDRKSGEADEGVDDDRAPEGTRSGVRAGG